MKGITHFASGLALATSFRPVVEAAAAGSCLPVLGAVAALLPDTLDFRFARLLERCEDEVAPDPTSPDPADIAGHIVASMCAAYHGGCSRKILLHTIPLGGDRWQSYVVSLAEEGEVAVRLGPVVDSGRQPWPGAYREEREVRIRLAFPLRLTYGSEVRVEAFLGPSLRFDRQEGCLEVHFLPWHRRWSHSLLLVLLFGAGVGALWGRWAGVVFAGGYAVHILQDQLGYLGSNLFWPLTRHRIPGLGLLHSADPLPNALVVWTSLALVLLNLNRFSPASVLPSGFLAAAWAVPFLLLGWWALRRCCFRKRPQRGP